MLERITLPGINRTILLFWAAWLSVVATTNVLDGLKTLGALPESFRFVSGNWQWITQVMDPLGVPRAVQAVLFVGAIGWEALGAMLFWWAVTTYRGRPLAREKATVYACGVNLALWATFQVLDEVFMAYQPEAVHRAIFISQVATLLLLHLLPSADRSPDVSATTESPSGGSPGGPTAGEPSQRA